MKPTNHKDLYDFQEDYHMLASRHVDDFPVYEKNTETGDFIRTKDAQGEMPHTEKSKEIKLIYNSDGGKNKSSVVHLASLMKNKSNAAYISQMIKEDKFSENKINL